ncbi:hypothetical protein HYC85_027347 [Camellia sinensis]|uniref:Uncharacterized protein n=1 Tax=Camellia sinensis TaxID=4442 RepID=A0A7J7G9W2_CAMSI|nr:hypothetical protein HYC85_027347 [Camellia sinensis]
MKTFEKIGVDMKGTMDQPGLEISGESVSLLCWKDHQWRICFTTLLERSGLRISGEINGVMDQPGLEISEDLCWNSHYSTGNRD